MRFSIRGRHGSRPATNAAAAAHLSVSGWPVELFFKALKQNRRVKTFGGRSANALKIQIRTALLAILVVEIVTFPTGGIYLTPRLRSG